LKLLAKARQINQHLNAVKLDRLLEEIKLEFDIDPHATLNDVAASSAQRGLDVQLERLDETREELRQVTHELEEEKEAWREDREDRQQQEQEEEF